MLLIRLILPWLFVTTIVHGLAVCRPARHVSSSSSTGLSSSSSIGHSSSSSTFPVPTTSWLVFLVIGQSNARGTNSQTSGYPTFPTTPRIQMFCGTGSGCSANTFAPASVPLYNEMNVGFSQSFANTLLPSLAANQGIILVNGAVGGTGFSNGYWFTTNQGLTANAITMTNNLMASVAGAIGGTPVFSGIFWQGGEADAGDNSFSDTYCHYLNSDLTPMLTFLLGNINGATASTPIVTGGMLPYWVNVRVPAASSVQSALYAINTTMAHSATADSSILANYLPGGVPNGDPDQLSGGSGDSGAVIHFNATEAVLMGQQYYKAYLVAKSLSSPVNAASCVQHPAPPVSLYNSVGMHVSSNYTLNTLVYLVSGQNTSLCVQGVDPLTTYAYLSLQPCQIGLITQLWNFTSAMFLVAANSPPSPLYYFNSFHNVAVGNQIVEYPVADLTTLSALAVSSISISYTPLQQLSLGSLCVDSGVNMTMQGCNSYVNSSQQFLFSQATGCFPTNGLAWRLSISAAQAVDLSGHATVMTTYNSTGSLFFAPSSQWDSNVLTKTSSSGADRITAQHYLGATYSKAFWVYLTAVGNSVVMSEESTTTPNQHYFYAQYGSSASGGTSMMGAGEQLASSGPDANQVSDTTATLTSILNQWVQYIVTRDASNNMLLYKGTLTSAPVLVGTGTASGSSWTGASAIDTIANFGQDGYGPMGSIYGLATWDRALNSSEVASVWQYDMSRTRLFPC